MHNNSNMRFSRISSRYAKNIFINMNKSSDKHKINHPEWLLSKYYKNETKKETIDIWEPIISQIVSRTTDNFGTIIIISVVFNYIFIKFL